eukprot:4539173-Amphidinium_carterae.2
MHFTAVSTTEVGPPANLGDAELTAAGFPIAGGAGAPYNPNVAVVAGKLDRATIEKAMAFLSGCLPDGDGITSGFLMARCMPPAG